MSAANLNQYFRSAFYGDISKLTDYLEKHPTNIAAQNSDGETALHCCASADHPEAALFLLNKGLNPNVRNVHGETALHYAVVNNLLQTVRVLTHHGADIFIRTAKGYKPVDLAGTVVMRDMLLEMENNLARRYEKLYELVGARSANFAFGTSLCLEVNASDKVARKDKDVLAKKLVKIYESLDCCVDFIKVLIQVEVDNTKQEGTLFRTDSMVTKIMGNYAKLVGTDYLDKTLGNLIRSALEGDPARFEVDPSKCGSPALAEVGLRNLSELCDAFLKSIFASSRSVPGPIRTMCRELHRIVGAKFPNSTHQAIGGFLFLRFFNAAVSNPNMFGITPLTQDELTMERRRPLVLIAKVLQNLASNVEFGDKEKFMSPMNAFVERNQAPMQEWFQGFGQQPELASASSKDANRIPEFNKDDVTAADLIFLYTLTFRLSDNVLKALDAEPEDLEEMRKLQSQFFLQQPVRKTAAREGPAQACTRRGCSCSAGEPHYLMPMYCLSCEHLVLDHGEKKTDKNTQDLNMYSASTHNLMATIAPGEQVFMINATFPELTPNMSKVELIAFVRALFDALGLPPPEEWKSYF